MSAVAKIETQARAVAVTPMQMLATAMEKGVDTAQLEKLLDLQERWEQGEARKAFNAAFADFKAEAVTIVKGTLIKDGPLKGKKHANLHDVVIATTPKLSQHGLAISWKLTRDEKDWMEVTCTLRHIAGHSESVSMGAAPDTGPGRNAIQARGSAKSYLERYTATAILGLAASDQDDDGQKSGEEALPTISDKQVADLEALLSEVGGDRVKFLRYHKIDSLDQIPAKNYSAVVRQIEAKRAK